MILCCGEALIDMLPREAEGRQAFIPTAGGAVFNTAIALGRLGVPAGLLTGLSSDFLGDLLRETLAASGVDASRAIVSDRPTTLAFVRLSQGQASYDFYDENSAGRMLKAADISSLGPGVEALFFGGISLMQEPCGSAYEALLAREHAGRAVMLDPNIRPGFIRDESGFRARIARMIGMADIVKLSDEDMRWLAGDGGSDDLAARWIQSGLRLLVVTRGADGAIGYTVRHRVSVAARRVSAVDTVGAGDTFNAGILAGLQERGRLDKQGLNGLTMEDVTAALEFGAAAAAVTVSRAGANPPWRAELDLPARSSGCST